MTGRPEAAPVATPGERTVMAPVNALGWAHPIVAGWFSARFGSPTEPQILGWPEIASGRDVLISAPTGAGKTLAAFLTCIDRLVRRALEGNLVDRTDVVYVSPLKALGNDIQKNLDGPLTEILARAREQGHGLTDIRTAVRTGDTLAHARRQMLTRPPHILVTTPESLFILLTSAKSREMLRAVSTVIVDEIHAMADDKRGAHLTLSLERLDRLVGRPIPRIGLSATQHPIETVGAFLSGPSRPSPHLVVVPPRRSLDLAVEVPRSDLQAVASNDCWEDIYERLAGLVREHRATLIFVNTRRLSERLAHHLSVRLGTTAVAAHHGSLSRRIRLDAERRLKAGDLRALVATASLELGIDVGTIDLVCLVNSPRSIAGAIQRIGRAGHWRGATPKGRLFPTTRDDLVECAALVRAIRTGHMDRLVVPDCPIDILAQQIVAACAADDWQEDELFAMVRRAYPFRDLTRTLFDRVIDMLAEGIAARRGRYAAYLHRDRVHGRLRGRRGARLAAITSGGAIPDTGLYQVIAEPEGATVGTVDEDFAIESQTGDVILLGNTSWRIRRVSTAGRVLVEDAHGAAPSVPFWLGEAPARTAELSQAVSDLRQQVDRLAPDARPGDAQAQRPGTTTAIAWLTSACGLSRSGAEQLVDYVVTGRAVLGVVPSQRQIVAERFFDEGGGMQLVIHAPFGARINKAWGLALRKRFCRSFNFELQAAATDNGINIALAEPHSFPLLDVFDFLRAPTVAPILEQAALASPIFGTRWRWDAGRALALLRFRGGRKTPIHLLRLQSDDLLASVFPDVAACQENIEGDIKIPDHPLVGEVMKDVLHDAMDLTGLIELLTDIADGRIACTAIDTPIPSVFAHEILNANPYAFLDDAPLEERRARAVELRRVIPPSVLAEVGGLDAAAIGEVQAQAWPDVRHADDLHDALLTLVAIPAPDTGDVDGPLAERVQASAHGWLPWFDQLARDHRAARATVGGRVFWVATEKMHVFRTAYPGAEVEPHQPGLAVPAIDDRAADLAIVQGWLSHTGPSTSAELATLVRLPPDRVEFAALQLEAMGWALRGTFRRQASGIAPDAHEWCERRLLARIHKLTLGILRREIEPVSAAQMMRWLIEWQHVRPGTQVPGDTGLLDVLSQLQGFEAPANAWESHILARRVSDYTPEMLDRLSLAGVVGWGRLSPHAALAGHASANGGARRVVPTSVAPITFFVREEADWMTSRAGGPARDTLTSNARDVLEQLIHRGASFFPELVKGSRHLAAEVETALWELVTAGLVTADGFDSLRALIDPRRRSGGGHGTSRAARARYGTGRWALLPATIPADRWQVVDAACRMLLRRYGVVFRELTARESNVPAWRDLAIGFRRLEDRGEVRGGRFVAGLVGEQFALPAAVESLRALRHRLPTGQTVSVSAADPLNLVGILVPGPRVAANAARMVTFRDGVAIDVDGSGRTGRWPVPSGAAGGA